MKISSFKLIVVGLCLLYSSKACSQQTDTATENTQIRQLVKNYEDAWNRHDPKGLADNYTVDATWVNWFGAYYRQTVISNHTSSCQTTRNKAWSTRSRRYKQQ